MEYTLIYKERAYDLPKFTKRIRKEIEQINGNNMSSGLDIDKKTKGMYLFIKDKIGEDACLEIFETADLEEIDINELSLVYLGICEGYDRPMNEHTQNTSAFDSISDDDRKLILEVLKNAGNLQNLTKNAAFRPPVRNL